ncbi:MAG: PIN domain-containing protein [Desulfobia sp.]
MSEKLFVDTNILLYAYDKDAGSKHEKANAIIKDLWLSGLGILSIQVLQEFYVNVTRKIPCPISPAQARSVIETYSTWEVVVSNSFTILKVSEIQERYQLSFWDSLIVAAASEADADKILTEDLNHNQVIEGIKIFNPL